MWGVTVESSTWVWGYCTEGIWLSSIGLWSPALAGIHITWRAGENAGDCVLLFDILIQQVRDGIKEAAFKKAMYEPYLRNTATGNGKPWRGVMAVPKEHIYVGSHLPSFVFFSTLLICSSFCETQGKLKDASEITCC